MFYAQSTAKGLSREKQNVFLPPAKNNNNNNKLRSITEYTYSTVEDWGNVGETRPLI